MKPKSLALPAGRWTWAPVVVALPVTVLGVATPVVGLVATMLVAVAGAMVTLPIGAFLSVLVLFAPVRLFVSVPLVGAELSMTGLVVFSLAVVLCARRLLEGRPALSRWEWVIALWWGWILISWLWSSDRRASFHGTYQWSLLFAAVFVTVQSLTAGPPAERTARRVITALLVLAAGWSALGLLESAIGLEGILAFLRSPGAALLFPTRLVREKLVAMDFNWMSGDHVQPFGPFINSIEFGTFTAAGMGVAVAIVVSRNRLAPRWLAFLTFVLALAANVAALKATGWLAAVVALVTVFVALGGSLRRLLTYGLLIGTVLTVFVVEFRQPLTERLRGLVVREGVPTGAVAAISRVSTWSHYARVALERPLTGSGLFTANTRGPLRWTALSESGVTVAYRLPTENGYLTTIVETGVPGLVALVIVVGGAAIVGLRIGRRYPGESLAQAAGVAAVGVAALLAGNLAVDGFAQETNQFLLGVLVGIVVVARRATARVKRPAA